MRGTNISSGGASCAVDAIIYTAYSSCHVHNKNLTIPLASYDPDISDIAEGLFVSRIGRLNRNLIY